MKSPTFSSTQPSTRKILITGATGSTGGYAITRLHELGLPVRALVHTRDSRSDKLAADGAEIVVGDLTDFDAVVAALDGITEAYFVYPIQVPGIVEATAYFAQVALENGVNAIVNMSQISARRIATSRAARDHWLAERVFDRSGIPVTHLRPTFFAEWLTYMAKPIRETDTLPLPFGEVPYAPIAAEDQGRAIAEVLNAPAPHAGKIYPLYGPVQLTQHEVADLLSASLGRKITYLPMEIAAFTDVLKSMGFNEHFQQHIASVAQDCRDGLFSGTNDWIEIITGQKPTGMSEFIAKHKALFV